MLRIAGNGATSAPQTVAEGLPNRAETATCPTLLHDKPVTKRWGLSGAVHRALTKRGLRRPTAPR